MAHAACVPAVYAGFHRDSAAAATATEQQEAIRKKSEAAEGRWIQLDASWQLTRDEAAPQGTRVTCSSSLYSSMTAATQHQQQAASRPPAAPGLAAAASARTMQVRHQQQQYNLSASAAAAAAAAYASMQAAPSSYGSHHPAAAPAIAPPQLYKDFRSSHMGAAAGGPWQYACLVPEVAPSSAPSSGGSAYSGFKAESVGSVSPGCPFQHVWNGSGAAGALGCRKGGIGKPTRLSLAGGQPTSGHGTSTAAAAEEEDLKCSEDMNTSPCEDMVLCDMRDSQDSGWLHYGGGASSVTSGRHPVPQWSVKARLHVAEVSVYTDATSPEALRIANALMSRIQLPGGVVYMHVDPDALLQQAAVAWQFPAMAVCLGSSYFQRLLVARRQLAAAALKVPSFEAYCRQLPAPTAPTAPASEVEVRGLQSTLRSILFTCLFLALKVADQLHARGLLPYMLTTIAGGVTASNEEALEIEARCLEGLEWRMGPYFAEDDLQGDDAELWLTAWQV